MKTCNVRSLQEIQKVRHPRIPRVSVLAGVGAGSGNEYNLGEIGEEDTRPSIRGRVVAFYEAKSQRGFLIDSA